MALFKRRETWWIDIAAPTGERIRRSAETRALPEHLRSIAGFSFTAGLRMGSNVIRLTWQQIPRTRRVTTIKASDIQDQKSLGIPLNDAAVEIIRSQIGNHDEFVFRYRGKPVTSANTDVPKVMIKLVAGSRTRWSSAMHMCRPRIGRHTQP